MAENNDEFVNIPVPKRHVMKVIQFLATLEQGDDIAGENNRDQWWAKDGRVSRLKSSIENETVRILLNLTASQPAKWVSFEQVYREAGRSSDQARADLRSLTVTIKRLFPNNPEGLWPFHFKEGSPIHYQMPDEIAREWNRS